MADNQYGYSTGYPGFAGQPATQGTTPYVNYPQWNAQPPNYSNTTAPYTQPPPSGPPQGYQSYSQPPPSFSQQPPQGNFTSPQYSNNKDNGNQYNRPAGGYSTRPGFDSGNDRGSGGGRPGGGNYNSGASRGGYNKDTRSGDLIVQEDTIFISGMSPRTSEAEIKTHFGAIGVIKNDKKSGKPKIWMYMDKATGRPKGEATVTYDDAHTANSAIEWFDGKEFNGCTISVQLASRRDNWQGGRGRGGGGGGSGGGGGGGSSGGGRGGGKGRGGPRDDDRGYDMPDARGGGGYSRGDDDFGRSDSGGYRSERGGGGGGMDYGRSEGGYRGGGSGGFKGGNRDGGGRGGGGRGERGGGKGFGGREGDWRCPNPDCGNTNFSWRQQCNRCSEDKPADAGSGGGDSDRRGGSGGGRGRGGFGGRGGGGGRGGRGGGRGGGPMREDYGNQRNRPY